MGVDNSQIARRYITEIWGKGNTDVIDELVGDDIVLRDPMSEQDARGKAVLRERVGMQDQSFTDVTITIKDVIVDGDRAVVLHTWRGKHVGEFMGLTPTNRTISCEVAEVLRIERGKVVENISYFDVQSMLNQMTPKTDTRPAAMASTS